MAAYDDTTLSVEDQCRILCSTADDLRGQWQTVSPLRQGRAARQIKLINTPELKEQRNAMVLYVFRPATKVVTRRKRHEALNRKSALLCRGDAGLASARR
jgi:hypothetical protein